MQEKVKCFYHGTGDYLDLALTNMLSIIETGFIKSKNKQNELKTSFAERGLYNGGDYISLCAWDESVDHRIESFDSAFNGWIYGCPFFILSNDINAVHCKKIKLGTTYDPTIERVSQFSDEWHVKDVIPITKVLGIALPLDVINADLEKGLIEPEMFEKVKKIIELAEKNSWFILERCDELAVESIENYISSIAKKR